MCELDKLQTNVFFFYYLSNQTRISSEQQNILGFILQKYWRILQVEGQLNTHQTPAISK